jgi:hypothetical protein
MRENVVREILTTERNYKSCLSALIDEYQQPLKDAIAQNPDVLLSTHIFCYACVSSCVVCRVCRVRVVSHLTTHVETPHVQDWDISSEQIKTLFCQVEVVMSFTTVLLNKVRSQMPLAAAAAAIHSPFSSSAVGSEARRLECAHLDDWRYLRGDGAYLSAFFLMCAVPCVSCVLAGVLTVWLT